MRGGCRPFDAHRAASAFYFDADCVGRRTRWQRYRHEALVAINRLAGQSVSYHDRYSAAFRFFHPATQYGCVDPPRQGNRCHRDAGLLARPDGLGFKQGAVGSSASTSGFDHLSRSVHVYA